VPSAPGWSFATIHHHTSADSRGSYTFSKGGTVVAELRARTDFVFALPTYTFAQPVAGAQAALTCTGSARSSGGATSTIS